MISQRAVVLRQPYFYAFLQNFPAGFSYPLCFFRLSHFSRLLAKAVVPFSNVMAVFARGP